MKKIIAAGGLVFNEYGALLMIYRHAKWDLPKGRLDEGEELGECAVREVQEETGVTQIELLEKIGITSHEYEERGQRVIKESHWFKMTSTSDQALIPQTEEGIEDVKWVCRHELAYYTKDSYENIKHIIEYSCGAF